MKRLVLLASCVAVGCLFVAMDRPPVEEVIEGQSRCGTNVCLGTPATPLKTSSEFAATGGNNDGGIAYGTSSLHTEIGVAPCTSGRCATTFRHTFAVAPQCMCNVDNGDAGCNLEAPASTTGVAFHSCAACVVDFMCTGAR